METQTWLSRHYKFISAENFTIFFVSSDDFLHVFLEYSHKYLHNIGAHFTIYIAMYTNV